MYTTWTAKVAPILSRPNLRSAAAGTVVIVDPCGGRRLLSAAFRYWRLGVAVCQGLVRKSRNLRGEPADRGTPYLDAARSWLSSRFVVEGSGFRHPKWQPR